MNRYRRGTASSVKDENIFVLKCPATMGEIFPLKKVIHPVGNYYPSPHEWIWKSCEDAYTVTWKLDEHRDIVGLRVRLKQMLEISMGFCPHRRCQLSNVTNPKEDGLCPQNLCYTKLENGAPSFGACCFTNGTFNSGELIGYYNKTQHAAKPIYKRSRVVLGGEVGGSDESYGSFINANVVHPGIIATQCPMANTLLDVAQMIKEQNISLWIQLSPSSESKRSSSDCVVLPNALTDLSSQQFSAIPTNLSLFGIKSLGTSILAQSLQIHSSPLQPGGEVCPPDHVMQHIWYRGWKDFDVPPEEDFEALRAVARRAKAVIADGGNVAISCLSGRGRTGTFASIVIGELESAKSHEDLVHIIIRMREHRDGMLEMPNQFRFASRMLSLPDTKQCGIYCGIRANHDSLSDVVLFNLYFSILNGMVFSTMLVIFKRFY